MAKGLTNDEIADRVAARIDKAIKRNIPTEVAIVLILTVMAGVGIYLLVAGASTKKWELLISGTACQVAIGWPISKLLSVRRYNVLLQVLPELIRTADTQDRKSLLYKFVERLMSQF